MRKKKRIKKILIILAVLFIILYVAVCNILVSAALVPSFMERLEAFQSLTEQGLEAQVHTDDIQQNRTESLSETEEWVQSADSEELSVTSEDGYRLVARAFYQKDENGEQSHKWVLLLHGYTGWKEEMYPIGCRYAAQGYQVLVPDLRCSGESEGDFIGMGWTDRLDNMLWLNMILEKDPEAEIVIHGQSMGAACALMMSGEELPDNVKAIVSDCAYSDAYEMFKKQMWEWFHPPSFPLLPLANVMLQLRGGYDLKDASPIQAVARSQIPTLFIHGTEDEMIDPQMTEDLYEAAACPKELLLVEGAGHAQSQDKDPELYYGTIFEFLEKYL